MIQETRKSSQSSALLLDLLHIVIGILIVILAVLAFLNPDENRILFPAIFLLAAVLNFANGFERFKKNRGKPRARASGTAQMAVGTALFLLCVLSVLTIWWG